MQPMPPELGASEVQQRSDGELFYIIQNGVRMTGMPPFGGNHGEEEIWKLVAFVRELPSLTEEHRQELKEAMKAQTQDHHGQDQRSAEHGTNDGAEHGKTEHQEHEGGR